MKTLSKRQRAVDLIVAKGLATEEEIGGVLQLSNQLVQGLLYGLVQTGELKRTRFPRDGKRAVLGYAPGPKCRPASEGVVPPNPEDPQEALAAAQDAGETPPAADIQNAFLQGCYGRINRISGGAA